MVPYSGNFHGRKLLRILRFVAIHESFSTKFESVASFVSDTSEQSARKFSLQRSYFSQITKVSPRKFPAIWYVQLSGLLLQVCRRLCNGNLREGFDWLKVKAKLKVLVCIYTAWNVVMHRLCAL